MDEQDIERQTIEETEPMESLSKEELHEKIIEDKKRANRSLILAFSALVAVVVVCLAWFVANNIINGGTNDIDAEADVAYELASVGERQLAETDHYLKDDSDEPRLAAGSEVEYDQYYDVENGKLVNSTGVIYHLGTSDIAWYQDGQTLMEPGARGKLEFYVIPKKSGLRAMTITLKAEAYSEPISEDDGIQKRRAKRVNNTILQNIIDGHILMFRHLDTETGYSEWIPPVRTDGQDSDETGINGNVFTITAQGVGITDGVFTANRVYKIVVYWIWPKYFRNYIYDSRSLNGDLFSDISMENQDYQDLLKFVNEQKIMGKEGGSKLFFNDETTEKKVTDAVINSDMTEDVLDICDKYYNLADEYIGKNAGYLYISATVN